MRGINPSHEECMSAFENLEIAVEKMVKIGLPDGIGKMYLTSIKSAHSYIKNYFKYNIQWESKCKNHCAKFALSDQLNKDFRSDCDHGDHDEECSHCEAIPKLLMSLLGAVKFVKENFETSELEMNELYYTIDQAAKAIIHYKSHLIQSFVQNSYWEEMLSKETLDTVFITQAQCLI